MEQVRERPAGKAVSAYVILKGKREVATVHVLRAPGGGVQVDVWQPYEAAGRSEAAARKAGEKIPPAPKYGLTLQQARAGGYGYDKFTAAMSGTWIDGHKLTDHCGASLKKPRGMSYFPADFKAPKGYSLSNFGAYVKATGAKHDPQWVPEHEGAETVTGYSDCYRLAGLDYLAAIGYTVIKVI